MANLDPKPNADPRVTRSIGTGFWAGLLGVLVIAIAAAFFIANRDDMSRGPETTGSATNENIGMKNPDPAANTPNKPERRQ